MPDPFRADGTPGDLDRRFRFGGEPAGRDRGDDRGEDAAAWLVAEACEPFDDLARTPLDALLERIGDARVVLIGEATHGTSEFYRLRSRITRELIVRHGFDIIAIEGDWADAEAVDRHVRGRSPIALRTPPFSRFPTWMWQNQETRAFIDWLADHDAQRAPEERVTFRGLDLYGLNNSIGAVLDYLDETDDEAARAARARYACFSPWEVDPAGYGRNVMSGRMRSCEAEAVATLRDLLTARMDRLAEHDDENFFDAERNAVVIREAERYYRAMYYGARESWNLRDRHMFDTLEALLEQRGPGSRAVVWAHNSHVGDADATEMGARGECNIGSLARQAFGDDARRIGFGTDRGTVAAASNWDGPVRVMDVRPALPGSHEHLCRRSEVPAFILSLRCPEHRDLVEVLREPRLERAIGVIYRPETERRSHYFEAILPGQFDEYVWMEETAAVRPLRVHELAGMPETYPFGL